jgi:SAM-dependent methyltransferase
VPTGPGRGYLLDNARAEAGVRLEAIAGLFDPVTLRHLDDRGVGTGWRCWEVGAGGPGVAAWLASRVGPTGQVVATDIDTTWIGSPPPDGVTVVRHDVTTGPVAGGPFDLIHARLVLVHLRDRADVVATLVAALRPGGWLVLEDADPALQPLACIDERGPDEALANRVRAGFRTLLAGRGAELGFGRTLPGLLREHGLVDVGADGYFPLVDPRCAVLERATVAHVRDELLDAGTATDEEIDRLLDALDAGRLDVTTAPLLSAWGRRRPE